MTKNLISAAFASAAFAMPGLALADDAMSGHGAMAPARAAAMATAVCRTAAEAGKPTAIITGSPKTSLVCKTLQPDSLLKMGAGLDPSHDLSVDQADAAWREFLRSALAAPGGTGGG
ncbi:MAG: hypothetical protein NVS4B13_12450 [Candidatus Elarobacter sp.]